MRPTGCVASAAELELAWGGGKLWRASWAGGNKPLQFITNSKTAGACTQALQAATTTCRTLGSNVSAKYLSAVWVIGQRPGIGASFRLHCSGCQLRAPVVL